MDLRTQFCSYFAGKIKPFYRILANNYCAAIFYIYLAIRKQLLASSNHSTKKHCGHLPASFSSSSCGVERRLLERLPEGL